MAELTGKAAKVAKVVGRVKSIADYRVFTGDVKAQKVKKAEYKANSPEAKQVFWSRRYNGFSKKIGKNGSDEKHAEAAKILKEFAGKKTVEAQRAAAQATLASLWSVYAGERGGGTRGPSDVALTMDDLNF